MFTNIVNVASHTGAVVSVSGNVTGGNLLTGGLISATSTITSSANITGGNLLTGGLASVTGNVIAGNVNTSTVRPTSGALTLSTASGAINLNPTGNVVLSANTYINNLASPAQAADAATKEYVDNFAAQGITYHQPVSAATTTTLATTTGGTITYAQPNGAANGVGATLTTTTTFNLIDTVNVQTVGTRILVKNEGNAVFNGIYTWSNATVIVRSTDADEYGSNSSEQLSLNDYFFVSNGNVNIGSAYVVNAPTGTITFGTSNITFAQFSSSQVYTANTSAGLSLTGTVFSAKIDNTTTAFDGSGNIIVKASAALTTPNIGAATGTSLSVTGNVTSGNVNTGGLITATGNVTGGNLLTGGLISATGTVTGTSHLGAVVSVTANVTGGNILTGGLISATANVTANNGMFTNIVNVASHTGTIVSVSGNVTGGNLLTLGLISAAGNITVGGDISLIGNIVDTGTLWVNTTANGNINLNPNGTGQTNIPAGILSVTANITGGNLLTGGLVSATANVIANNGMFTNIVNVASHTGAVVSVSGNVTGGNLLTGGLISATSTITSAANITGGNLLTGGLISAASTITGTSHLGSVVSVTANITGGNLLTGGLITATGNVTGGNILTGGLVSATANVTGGNLLTAGIISATGTITTAGNLSLTGNIVDAGELWINTTANGNINLNANGTGQTNIPTGILSVTGNIQGGNLRTVGQISATGNITGNYYIGNGAFLTGLSAGSASNIANGATTITIPVASGNIAMSVAGQSNTVVINLGSFTMYGTFAGPKTLQANVSVADAVNALLLGPVTIDAGYHIDIPNSSTLYVYAP
jgi:hypothetical protein